MAISSTGTFHPEAIQYQSNFSVEVPDLSGLEKVAATDFRIREENAGRYADSLESYSEARNSLGASFMSQANLDAYEQERKRYGLDDASMVLTEQQLRDGFASKDLSNRAKMFASSPRVKSIIEDDIRGDAFGRTLQSIPDVRMRDLAGQHFDEFRSGKRSGGSLKIDDYKVYDYTSDLESLMESLAPELEHVEAMKDGSIRTFSRRNPRGLEVAIDRLLELPEYQRMKDAGIISREMLVDQVNSLGLADERTTKIVPAKEAAISKPPKQMTSAEQQVYDKLDANEKIVVDQISGVADDQIITDPFFMSIKDTIIQLATEKSGDRSYVDLESLRKLSGLYAINRYGTLTAMDGEELSKYVTEQLNSDMKAVKESSALQQQLVDVIVSQYVTDGNLSPSVKAIANISDVSVLREKVDAALQTYLKSEEATVPSEGQSGYLKLFAPQPSGSSETVGQRIANTAYDQPMSPGAYLDYSDPNGGDVRLDLSTVSKPLKSLITLGEIGTELPTPESFNQIFSDKAGPRFDERVTSMTLAQLISARKKSEGKNWNTSVGPYQIKLSTAEDVLKRVLKIDPNNFKLTPENQERLANQLLISAGLDDYLKGNISMDAFAKKLGKTWTSLPTGAERTNKYAESNMREALLAISPPINLSPEYGSAPIVMQPMAMKKLLLAHNEMKDAFGVGVIVGRGHKVGARDYYDQASVAANGRTFEQVVALDPSMKMRPDWPKLEQHIRREVAARGKNRIITSGMNSKHQQGLAVDLSRTAFSEMQILDKDGNRLTFETYKEKAIPILEKYGFSFPLANDPNHLIFKPQ